MATHIPSNQTVPFELHGQNFQLGRAAQNDPNTKLSVRFDPKLSRKTAILTRESDCILVERDASRYPLFHEGEEKERFRLYPGQRFSSAETVFELISQTVRTLTVQAVEEVQETNSEQILKVLLGLQPLLNTHHSPKELASGTVTLLRELLPGAQVAFFELGLNSEVESLSATVLRPSRSLVADCLAQQAPVYHVWDPTQSGGQPTQFSNENWALVAPVLTSSERLILYATGHESQTTPGELQRGALALVAQTLSQHFEGRHSLRLAAEVEAQERANTKLRALLRSVERSLSLTGQDAEQAFLDGAADLTGADRVEFRQDLGKLLQEHTVRTDSDESGCFLAVAFEHYHPKGIICRNSDGGAFEADAHQWLSALLGFAETVFENRRLHHQVRAALQELKNSQSQLIRSSQWAAAGRLAANAAHELNTPLGAIKLALETAQTRVERDGAGSLDSLELAHRALQRCKKVTDRLLMYSKLKDDKTLDEFSLVTIVDDSLSSLALLLKNRKIELSWSAQTDYKIRGNRRDCYWAVTNVLTNAIDAMAQAEERRIELSLADRDTRALLSIEDSGPGVPDEVRETLFEPFVTSKKMGEGSGLGLALSRRNLRRWDGDISLGESRLGGAAFRIELPTVT